MQYCRYKTTIFYQIKYETQVNKSSQAYICLPPLVMDFMIRLRESVRVVQFAKKSRSFVCSFVRSVVFPVAVNHSLSLSDSPPPFVPRSHSQIANASGVGQTHFLPRSQHSNESRMHNAVLTAESVSVRLPRSHFSNEITIHNRAMVQMVINQHNIN